MATIKIKNTKVQYKNGDIIVGTKSIGTYEKIESGYIADVMYYAVGGEFGYTVFDTLKAAIEAVFDMYAAFLIFEAIATFIDNLEPALPINCCKS